MRSPYLEFKEMYDSWGKKKATFFRPACERIHDKYNTCTCSCHKESFNSEYGMCEKCYKDDKCYLCYHCNNFIIP